MATGLKSRVLYKEHTTDGVWTGTYKLLMRAKTLPSPIGERNMIDVSTLEDTMEVQEPGRRAAASVSIQGAMEKAYLDDMISLQGKKLDIIHLYGTDGVGSIAKLAYIGQVDVTPDEASDDHLTMTANIAVSTVPEFITDDVTVTVSGTGADMTFTVAAAG